jgi:regulator of cell morphogenesis and NO signaling
LENKTMAIKTYPSVGELVATHPAFSRVFEKVGIDYCCGGKRSLDEVCLEKGLDPETLLTALKAIDVSSDTEQPVDWNHQLLAELCDNIVSQHHEYLREELPRLKGMLEKLVRVHGANHPELGSIEKYFVQLKSEMEQHMMKEEHVLFPAIRDMERLKKTPSISCGTLDMPISVMEQEHELAGSILKIFRELSDGYTPPPSACNTYRAAYEALARLEADMHEHVHKENNILFPRALAMAATFGCSHS